MLYRKFISHSNKIVHIYVLGKEDVIEEVEANNSTDYYTTIVHNITGIKKEKIFLCNQVHKDTLVSTEEISKIGSGKIEADSMYTTHPGEALVIKTADCLPICVWDFECKFVSAIHAGWRGTNLKISSTVLNRIKNIIPDIKNLTFFIGPFIHKDSYEIKEDVAKFFSKYNQEVIEKKGISFYFDLYKANKYDLMQSFSDSTFLNLSINTFSDQKYYSFRRKEQGRNLTIIYFE